ncbi:hypothetical protein BDV36DRAFT_268532 [Aspergillus pseudocaelatus]|uniref:Uncharacterized protein n=1 Tax=Aspergillus pseudocaelatus TaxID=1825620 RepID=A0ABQ6WD81_9EURO|nr:hypothetical protein BDV36DRAFT_268532 [Aspergillus pseudocaelatus]
MDGLLDGLCRPCSPRSIAFSPNNGIRSLTQPPGLLQSASNSGAFDPTLRLSTNLYYVLVTISATISRLPVIGRCISAIFDRANARLPLSFLLSFFLSFCLFCSFLAFLYICNHTDRCTKYTRMTC